MLYKPTYCCHCGESVERIEWRIWTSRKFCENCEIVFRKEEWFVRIGIAGTVLLALLGFGSYLKSPEKSLNLSSGPNVFESSNKTREVTTGNTDGSANRTLRPVNANQASQTGSHRDSNATTKEGNLKIRESQQNGETDAVYFCGAQTKKGLPCTRKVRGGGRCWQHEGQPAVLPTEKLIAGQ
jgi:hypothetical protein